MIPKFNAETLSPSSAASKEWDEEEEEEEGDEEGVEEEEQGLEEEEQGVEEEEQGVEKKDEEAAAAESSSGGVDAGRVEAEGLGESPAAGKDDVAGMKQKDDFGPRDQRTPGHEKDTSTPGRTLTPSPLAKPYAKLKNATSEEDNKPAVIYANPTCPTPPIKRPRTSPARGPACEGAETTELPTSPALTAVPTSEEEPQEPQEITMEDPLEPGKEDPARPGTEGNPGQPVLEDPQQRSAEQSEEAGQATRTAVEEEGAEGTEVKGDVPDARDHKDDGDGDGDGQGHQNGLRDGELPLSPPEASAA